MVSTADQYGVDDDLADTLLPIDSIVRESSIPPTVMSYEDRNSLRIDMDIGSSANDFSDGLSQAHLENEPFFGSTADCQDLSEFLLSTEHHFSEPTSPTNTLFGQREVDSSSPLRSPMMNRYNTDDSRLNPPLQHEKSTVTEIEQGMSNEQNVNTDRGQHLRSTAAQSHGPRATSRVEELRRTNVQAHKIPQSHRIPRTTNVAHSHLSSLDSKHYGANLRQPPPRPRNQSPNRATLQPRSYTNTNRLSGSEYNRSQQFQLSHPPQRAVEFNHPQVYQQQGMVISGFPLAPTHSGNFPEYYVNSQHGNIRGSRVNDMVFPVHNTHTSFTPDHHQRESSYSTSNIHDDQSAGYLTTNNWQDSLSGRVMISNSRGGLAYNMERNEDVAVVPKRESSLDPPSRMSRDVSLAHVQRAGVTPRDISGDDSFPRTEKAKQKYLSRMVQAMHLMHRATDNEGIVRNWGNALNKAGYREEIEDHCSILMGDMMRKHQQMEPLVKSAKPRHYDRFEELVDEMVQNFQEHKTMCKHVLQAPYKWVLVDDPQAQAHRIENNRGVNAKKKVAIETGRAAMGLEGQGKGKKPIKVERAQAGSVNDDDEEDADFEIDPEYPYTNSTPKGTTYLTPTGNNPSSVGRSQSFKRTRHTNDEDDEDEEFKPDRSRKRAKGASRSKYQLNESGVMLDTSLRSEPNLLGSSPGPQPTARRTQGHISAPRGRTSHRLSEQNVYTETADDEYGDDEAYGGDRYFSHQPRQRRH